LQVIDLKHTIDTLEVQLRSVEHDYGEERVLHSQCTLRLNNALNENEVVQKSLQELQLKSKNQKTTIYEIENKIEQNYLTQMDEATQRYNNNVVARTVVCALSDTILKDTKRNKERPTTNDNDDGLIRVVTETLSAMTSEVIGCERATLWLVREVGGASVLQTWCNGKLHAFDGTTGVVGAAGKKKKEKNYIFIQNIQNSSSPIYFFIFISSFFNFSLFNFF